MKTTDLASHTHQGRRSPMPFSGVLVDQASISVVKAPSKASRTRFLGAVRPRMTRIGRCVNERNETGVVFPEGKVQVTLRFRAGAPTVSVDQTPNHAVARCTIQVLRRLRLPARTPNGLYRLTFTIVPAGTPNLAHCPATAAAARAAMERGCKLGLTCAYHAGSCRCIQVARTYTPCSGTNPGPIYETRFRCYLRGGDLKDDHIGAETGTLGSAHAPCFKRSMPP